MNEKYVCGLCGATHYDLDSYLKCVSKCGEQLKKQKKEEEENKKRLARMNADRNRVNEAKRYYEEKLNNFKINYPKEYETYFGHVCNCGSNCKEKKTENHPVDTKSIEVSYESNGKDKPTMSAKVNGKEIKDDDLKTLLADPNMEFIAKMLRF